MQEGDTRYIGERSRRWPEGRPLCGAKKRREDATCIWTAGRGTAHYGTGSCERHGGNLPTHVVHAERVQAERLAAAYSVPRDIHPLEGLIEQYQHRMGEVAWLRDRINELPEEALFWGVTEETDRRGDRRGDTPGGDTEDGSGERLRTGSAAEFERKSKAGPNALLEQYDKAQAAAEKLGADIIRIGLESMSASLTERFGSLLGTAMQLANTRKVARLQEVTGCTAEQAELLAADFRACDVEAIASFAGARGSNVIEGSAA